MFKQNILAAAFAVCLYPHQMEITTSEFSTGTPSSPAYMIEVSGELDGNYTTLTAYNVTVGKFLGLGRVTAPDKIVFKPARVDKLTCEF